MYRANGEHIGLYRIRQMSIHIIKRKIIEIPSDNGSKYLVLVATVTIARVASPGII